MEAIKIDLLNKVNSMSRNGNGLRDYLTAIVSPKKRAIISTGKGSIFNKNNLNLGFNIDNVDTEEDLTQVEAQLSSIEAAAMEANSRLTNKILGLDDFIDGGSASSSEFDLFTKSTGVLYRLTEKLVATTKDEDGVYISSPNSRSLLARGLEIAYGSVYSLSNPEVITNCLMSIKENVAFKDEEGNPVEPELSNIVDVMIRKYKQDKTYSMKTWLNFEMKPGTHEYSEEAIAGNDNETLRVFNKNALDISLPEVISAVFSLLSKLVVIEYDDTTPDYKMTLRIDPSNEKVDEDSLELYDLYRESVEEIFGHEIVDINKFMASQLYFLQSVVGEQQLKLNLIVEKLKTSSLSNKELLIQQQYGLCFLNSNGVFTLISELTNALVNILNEDIEAQG